MFQSSKVKSKDKVPRSLKSMRVLNTHEAKKLNESMGKFQKEYDKKMRKLSVEQTKLLTAHTRRNSVARRGSLPAGPATQMVFPPEGRERKLSCALSDSAINYNQRVTAPETKPADILEINGSCRTLLSTSTFRERINSPPLIRLPSINDKNRVDCAGLPSTGKSPTAKDSKKSSTSIIEKLSSKLHQLTSKVGTENVQNLPFPPLQDATLSPRVARSGRRIGCAVYSTGPRTGDESAANARLLSKRRKSCPNLELATDGEFAEGRSSNAITRQGTNQTWEAKGELEKQMEGMRNCRYLRYLPSAIEESDEYDADPVFGGNN